jgi:ribonuclease P protein component
MGHRFGPDRRIKRRRDFLRIQGAGRRVTCAHFTFLVAAQSTPGAPSRLGLVVTKKIGCAVARNRVKRLCRECFRLSPELVPSGVDLVVIAKPGADRLVLEEVQAEWRRVARPLAKRAEEALARPQKAPDSPAAPPRSARTPDDA